MVINLSRSSLSSITEQLVHLLTPHTGGVLPILPQQQQAQSLPAAKDLNRHILDRSSVWVATVFLEQGCCLVETMFEPVVSGSVSRRSGLLSKDKSTHVSCHKTHFPHLLVQ